MSTNAKPELANVEEKLRGSVSFESLVAEQSILRRVTNLRWRCTHGAFFVDPTTSKIREADVLATRYWKRRRSARRQGRDDTEILDDLLTTVRRLNLYHPIVVIEAPLWLVSESGQLLRIFACRFEQVQAGGGFSRWVDIVHRPHFDGFISKLTTYYEDAFMKAGAKAH